MEERPLGRLTAARRRGPPCVEVANEHHSLPRRAGRRLIRRASRSLGCFALLAMTSSASPRRSMLGPPLTPGVTAPRARVAATLHITPPPRCQGRARASSLTQTPGPGRMPWRPTATPARRSHLKAIACNRPDLTAARRRGPGNSGQDSGAPPPSRETPRSSARPFEAVPRPIIRSVRPSPAVTPQSAPPQAACRARSARAGGRVRAGGASLPRRLRRAGREPRRARSRRAPSPSPAGRGPSG